MRSSEYIYYQVGDQRTSNTLTAFELAKGNVDNIKLYWADDQRAQFNWTQEPVESINELIDMRVRELRAQYPYLCLWYSGGYDSQSILDSFVRTGTRLDEVVIFGRPWIKPVNGIDIERDDPRSYAEQVKQYRQPWLKITLVDYDPNMSIKFYLKHGSDWIYNDPGHFPWFTKSSRTIVEQHQADFIGVNDIIGRRDIEGVDKPILNLRDNKWYVQLNDKSLRYHMDTNKELFYMAPEATRLYIKQAWLAIKWFESQPECSHEFVHQVQSNSLGGAMYQRWNLGFGREQARSRFESQAYFKSTFFSGSAVDTVEARGVKEYASLAEEKAYKIWKTGLSYLETQHKELWNTDRGFPTVMGTEFYIKDFQPNEQ